MTLVPNETEQALNRQYDVYAAAREEYRKKIDEQADRIEQLENALTEIYKKGLHNQGGAYKNGFYDCFKIARRALGIPHMSFDAARAALEDRT